MSTTLTESLAQFPSRHAIGRNKREHMRSEGLSAELQASLARESVLLREKRGTTAPAGSTSPA